jgi:hypothetical protein
VQCMKNHGVTPPPNAASGGTHTGPPPAGAGAGAGGANNSARQAAFKACGASGQHRPGSSTTTTGK